MRRIFDPVYGYIELEEDEFDLITSPIFQRLQRIKQTGPLHLVFPGAVHTRYSHSIGVFHIVKKMILHLKSRMGKIGKNYFGGEREERELKFAALLHDIGHLPVSHCGERALIAAYESKRAEKYKQQGTKRQVDPKLISWTNLFDDKYLSSSTQLHECLSVEMVLKDKEIDKVLQKAKYRPNRENIAGIIVGEHKNQRLNALLHSELDADRLDYLLRDSYFIGVDYGKIDLDYIISRLIMPTEEELEGEAFLCVEAKGLHTVEHYILSRFFLTTQVLSNRRVRALEILFDEVMKYMILSKKSDYHILDLEELLQHIKQGNTDNLHEIYAYTDAQVFIKMRKLHEYLDKKVKSKKGNENEEERYINDCIKMIMDTQIAGPVESAQILVELKRNEADMRARKYPSERRRIESKAIKIAKKAAEKLNIHQERIKVDIKPVSLMTYTNIKDTQEKPAEEPNREAVRIYIENEQKEENRIKFAAESKACILGSLVDRELLLFNVFYVKSSREQAQEKARIRKIREFFKEFVAKNF
ncbi:hypothetical protein ES703_86223 [subsurface metagenome]